MALPEGGMHVSLLDGQGSTSDIQIELLERASRIFNTVMRSYVAKSGDKCCTCDPDTAFL